MPPPFSMGGGWGGVGLHIVSTLSVHTYLRPSVPSVIYVTLGFRVISFERICVLD